MALNVSCCSIFMQGLPPPPDIRLLGPPPRPPSRKLLPPDLCPWQASATTDQSEVTTVKSIQETSQSSTHTTNTSLTTFTFDAASSQLTKDSAVPELTSSIPLETTMTSLYTNDDTTATNLTSTDTLLINHEGGGGLTDTVTNQENSHGDGIPVTNKPTDTLLIDHDGGGVTNQENSHGDGIPVTNKTNIPYSESTSHLPITVRPSVNGSDHLITPPSTVTSPKFNNTDRVVVTAGEVSSGSGNGLEREEVIIIIGAGTVLLLIIALIAVFIWMRKPRLRIKPACHGNEDEINFLYNYRRMGRRWSDKVATSSPRPVPVVFTTSATSLSRLVTGDGAVSDTGITNPTANGIGILHQSGPRHNVHEMNGTSIPKLTNSQTDHGEKYGVVTALKVSKDSEKEHKKQSKGANKQNKPTEAYFVQNKPSISQLPQSNSKDDPSASNDYVSNSLLKTIRRQQLAEVSEVSMPDNTGNGTDKATMEGYLQTDGAEVSIHKGNSHTVTHSTPRDIVFSPRIKDLLQSHLNSASTATPPQAEAQSPAKTYHKNFTLLPDSQVHRLPQSAPKKNKTRWERRMKDTASDQGYSSKDDISCGSEETSFTRKRPVLDNVGGSTHALQAGRIEGNTNKDTPERPSRSYRDRKQRNGLEEPRPSTSRHHDKPSRTRSPDAERRSVERKERHHRHRTSSENRPKMPLAPLKISSALEYSKLSRHSSHDDSSSNASGNNEGTSASESKPILRNISDSHPTISVGEYPLQEPVIHRSGKTPQRSTSPRKGNRAVPLPDSSKRDVYQL